LHERHLKIGDGGEDTSDAKMQLVQQKWVNVSANLTGKVRNNDGKIRHGK